MELPTCEANGRLYPMQGFPASRLRSFYKVPLHPKTLSSTPSNIPMVLRALWVALTCLNGVK
ncbi:MAG: hypothetical protein AAF915_00280 [Cyanobacteria bacterium P01_D01_bin.50]